MTGDSSTSGKARCIECGWPIYEGQPVRTVAREETVHRYCRDGVPEGLTPRSNNPLEQVDYTAYKLERGPL